MPHEVGRELRRDDAVDRPAVRLAQVDAAPGGGVREDLLLRVPLEGQAHQLALVAARPQLRDQLARRGSPRRRAPAAPARRRPAPCERSRPSLRANRKLMTSPSCTAYSLPSSRTSPCSRQAAIDPRAIRSLEADHLRADEAARDVAVDLARGQLRRRAARDRPGAALVLAGGEERDVAEQVVGRADDPVDAGLGRGRGRRGRRPRRPARAARSPARSWRTPRPRACRPARGTRSGRRSRRRARRRRAAPCRPRPC